MREEKKINELTRNIWNKIIAEPKNEKVNFNFSPGKLRKVIEKTISPNNLIDKK